MRAAHPIVTDKMVNAAAKVIADYKGHGMREKCMDVARAALEAAIALMPREDG